eukprot:6195686-Pleurochrysis_carterae.AAC.1
MFYNATSSPPLRAPREGVGASARSPLKLARPACDARSTEEAAGEKLRALCAGGESRGHACRWRLRRILYALRKPCSVQGQASNPFEHFAQEQSADGSLFGVHSCRSSAALRCELVGNANVPKVSQLIEARDLNQASCRHSRCRPESSGE